MMMTKTSYTVYVYEHIEANELDHMFVVAQGHVFADSPEEATKLVVLKEDARGIETVFESQKTAEELEAEGIPLDEAELRMLHIGMERGASLGRQSVINPPLLVKIMNLLPDHVSKMSDDEKEIMEWLANCIREFGPPPKEGA
jgi:hypothetical protein